MKKIIILLSILSFFILTSCFANSEQPLSPIEDAVIDSSLLGMWSTEDGGYVFFNAIQNNITQMTFISPDTIKTDIEHYIVFPTFSNGNSYLNYRNIDVDSATGTADTSNYAFMIYEIKRNRLKINLIMDLDDAVKSGRLKGRIIPGDPKEKFDFSSFVVTDSSAEVLKVVDSIVLHEELEDWLKLKRCR